MSAKDNVVVLPESLLSKEEVQEQLASLGVHVSDLDKLFAYLGCVVNDKVDEVVVNLLHPHFGTYHQLTDAGKQGFCNSLLDSSWSMSS